MVFIRISILVIILLAGNVYAIGQSTVKPSQPPKTDQSIAAKSETVEEIDGVWELSGYLGNKLINEMRNRMNLNESTKTEDVKTKRIKINIGPFKIERIESI